MTEPTRAPSQTPPLCRRKDHGPTCSLCEVLAHNQEKAWDKGQCGKVSDYPFVVCDRESSHEGEHRGYFDTVDEVIFWTS